MKKCVPLILISNIYKRLGMENGNFIYCHKVCNFTHLCSSSSSSFIQLRTLIAYVAKLQNLYFLADISGLAW